MWTLPDDLNWEEYEFLGELAAEEPVRRNERVDRLISALARKEYIIVTTGIRLPFERTFKFTSKAKDAGFGA